MIRWVVLLAAMMIAAPALAATYDHAQSASVRMLGFVFASDGVTTRPESRTDLVVIAASESMFVDETGSEIGSDRVRLFSGYVGLSVENYQLPGDTGRVSGTDFTLVFDTIEVDFIADPIARIRDSGEQVRDSIGASIRVSGSVLFGSEAIPFTYIREPGAADVLATMTSAPNSLSWSAQSIPNALLTTFTRDGLTFTVHSSFIAGVFVPEPGTALLLGLGLIGLTSARRWIVPTIAT